MIKERIDSPFAKGKAKLVRESGSYDFRNKSFDILEHFYVCEVTGQEFTNSEVDQINLNQVYNQYRDLCGLPFPDQIKSIRESYGVTATKMSSILGLGANTYRLYEQGDVPSAGNGRLIMAASDPEEFIKFLRMSKDLVGEKDYERYYKKASMLLERKHVEGFETMIYERIFGRIVPDEFSGYKLPSLEKISHMIMFFSQYAETWKVKLNKLLFYSDFTSFKRTGFGISGLDYRAIQWGPVPTQYQELYTEIGRGDLLELVESPIDSSGNWGSYFVPILTFNEDLFEEHELKIMEEIASKFKWFDTKSISNYSHKEKAWEDNINSRAVISYKKYAFLLNE